MAAVDPPRRKRGRPPKPKAELSRRPTVALRVPVELYDLIVEAAAANGRSLSEEMEARVTEAFRQSQPKAVRDAVSIALFEKNEEIVEECGGRLGYYLHRIQRQFLGSIIYEAHQKFLIKSSSELTEDFVNYVCARLDDTAPRIKQMWRTRIMLSKFVQATKDVAGMDAIEEFLEGRPDLKRAFIDKFSR